MCVTGWALAQEPFHLEKRVLIVDGQTVLVLVLLVKSTSLFRALRLRQNKKFKDHSNRQFVYIKS